ncbi:DUF6624 domain-containing protein [Winogradskyella aurantiaca]|uniref:DUF6624 domain-containing protein n=1 Tax=Winogradskyella aurantiaca TaxID=2219558 RepID=UPI000E1D824E|nr:DUF6624 domain-containing protein [Winogradskyella aurantiaca]
MKNIPLKVLLLAIALLTFSCQDKPGQSATVQSEISAKNLSAILDSIWMKEQLPIRERDSMMDIYGPEHDYLIPITEEIRANHEQNMKRIAQIIDTFGWPSPEQSGTNGNWTICNVIQHDTPETREKYIPIMRQAVKDGKLEARWLVRTEDRLATDKGELQIYGGQMKYYKETKSFNVWPVYDPVNVNKRRAAIGLNTIEEHLKERFDFEWNLEEQIERTKAFGRQQLSDSTY